MPLHSDSVVSPGLIQAKALGDTNDDLVYTPVTPCRSLDTRNGTVPPYNAQMVGGAAFPVAANLANFAPQGGSAINCGLPASFSGIAVTLTVLNPNYDAFMAASNTSDFTTLRLSRAAYIVARAIRLLAQQGRLQRRSLFLDSTRTGSN